MRFEWDSAKDIANRIKHGIGFEEAGELFDPGVDYLEIFDEVHSEDEDRFIAVGPIRKGLVVVIWTETLEDTVRIISARLATQRETVLYRQHWEKS